MATLVDESTGRCERRHGLAVQERTHVWPRRGAELSRAALLMVWPAHAEMRFAASPLPQPVAAEGTATLESSQAQPQNGGHDAEARNGDPIPAESMISSPSPDSISSLTEPFGLTPLGTGTIPPKWRGVEADTRADRQILASVRRTRPVRWRRDASLRSWHWVAHKAASLASALSIALSILPSRRRAIWPNGAWPITGARRLKLS